MCRQINSTVAVAMNPLGATKLPLKVDGTPKEPQIDMKSMALIGSFGVIGGGLINLSGNLVSSSSELVGSSVTAVGSVGSGVLDATKSLGVGLFKTTKGLVTLDGEELGDGVKGATAGTGSAAGGVTDAGGDLPMGLNHQLPFAVANLVGGLPPSISGTKSVSRPCLLT